MKEKKTLTPSTKKKKGVHFFREREERNGTTNNVSLFA